MMFVQGILAALLFVFAGCGLTDRMDDTNRKIDDTNEKLEITKHKMDKLIDHMRELTSRMDSMLKKTVDLEEGQKFLGSFNTFFKTFNDDSQEEVDREAAFHTIVKYGDRDRLGLYIGAPTVIKAPLDPITGLANVSYIFEKSHPADAVLVKLGETQTPLFGEMKQLNAIRTSTYFLAWNSAQTLIDFLIGAAFDPHLKKEKEEEVLEYFPVYAQVFTAILGARLIIPAKNPDGTIRFNEQGLSESKIEYALDLKTRELWAKKLQFINSSYSVGYGDGLQKLIELRLKSDPAEFPTLYYRKANPEPGVREGLSR